MDFQQLPDAWYYRTARNIGVPEMFLEDAIQEMKLAVWQGRYARTACIDFVRQYGPKDRTGLARLTVPLDEGIYLTFEAQHVETWMDIQELFRRLPKRLRLIVEAHLYGYCDREIARKIGLSPKRVGTLRHEALGVLSKLKGGVAWV